MVYPVAADPHPKIRTLFESSLLTVLDYRCAGWDDGGEEIPEAYEIVLPRAGAYQRKDVHGSFLADPNQVLFYNQGEPYEISHPFHGGDASTIFILAPALLIEMMRAYHPNFENNPKRIFPRSHITFGTRLQALQYWLLRANKETLESEEQLIILFGEIIYALHQGTPPQRRHSSAGTLRAHAEQAHAIKTFLNTHVQSRLRLEQISSAVHLSPYHLCRIFKQDTGMTLHQYTRRLRLFNAAERMLEDPRARLDLLALDYGFSSHANFSTAFRETFGFNPSELRNAHIRQMRKILKA